MDLRLFDNAIIASQMDAVILARDIRTRENSTDFCFLITIIIIIGLINIFIIGTIYVYKNVYFLRIIMY